MFGHRFFGARYFGARYFGPAVAGAAGEAAAYRTMHRFPGPEFARRVAHGVLRVSGGGRVSFSGHVFQSRSEENALRFLLMVT